MDNINQLQQTMTDDFYWAQVSAKISPYYAWENCNEIWGELKPNQKFLIKRYERVYLNFVLDSENINMFALKKFFYENLNKNFLGDFSVPRSLHDIYVSISHHSGEGIVFKCYLLDNTQHVNHSEKVLLSFRNFKTFLPFLITYDQVDKVFGHAQIPLYEYTRYRRSDHF